MSQKNIAGIWSSNLWKAVICFFVSLLFWGGCTEKPRVYRVGVLAGFPPFAAVVDGFKSEMAELGYKEGENILNDVQEVSLDPDDHRRVIRKFVADKVDLIFVYPTGATIAAKKAAAGSNIPVLFAMAGIEGNNLVESVGHPGGNITGVRYPGPDLTLKRLEFLQELIPGFKRLYVTYNPDCPANKIPIMTLSLAILLVAGSFEVYFNFRTQREIVAGRQQLIAKEAATEVASFIQVKFSLLEAAVKLGDPASVSRKNQKRILAKLLGLQPAFRQIVLLDSQEEEIAKISRLSQAASGNLIERIENEAFSQVKEGNRYIGSVYVDDVTNEPLVVIAIPVTGIFGDFQGTLMAEVNLKFMWDLVDRLKIGKQGLAYVVDRRGDLIAFGDIARVLQGQNLSHLKDVNEFINSRSSLDETRADISKGINKTTIVGTYVPLGTPDWAVVIELPVSEAYREVIKGIAISVGAVLIMAILAGLAGVVLARRLADPLLDLTETASRIAGGEVGLRAIIQVPDMDKKGYSKGYSASVLTIPAIITAIVPPSIAFILYGTIGEVSIGRLFAAGIPGGLIMMLALMVTVSITAKKKKYLPERQRASFKEVVEAFINSVWAFLFPVILIGGIRFGLFTPAEAGAFAAVYALIVGVLFYRELTWEKFIRTLEFTIVDIGSNMFIIAMSGIFGYGLAYEQMGEVFSEFMLGISNDPRIILLIIVGALVIVGMFIESVIIILLFTSVLLPMVTQVGVDPVHFWVVMMLMVTLGLVTPPVGVSMYTVCSIIDCPVEKYVKECIPFFVAIVIVDIIFIFFPDIVLFIPNLIFGKG